MRQQGAYFSTSSFSENALASATIKCKKSYYFATGRELNLLINNHTSFFGEKSKMKLPVVSFFFSNTRQNVKLKLVLIRSRPQI